MAADPRDGRGAGEEIATSTLAEIYAQQGLLGRALAIYRRMQVRTPEDPAIADRIERLERRIAEAGAEPVRELPEPREPARDAVPGAESAAAPRERLPWDPPLAGAGEVPPAEPVPLPAEPAPPPAEPAPPPAARVQPLDPQAFAAWLEGR